MNGKGSKRRPSLVDNQTLEENWKRIFGMKEHKRGVITEEISKHFSDNGKREATVIKTESGYMVELYEKSRYIRTVDVRDKSLSYAEDTAENWTLGVLN